ncbi:ABC transporter permease [Streptomyces rugosispiralis]|uniref:Transport permease protein n=1 Tax=Streptomyces rugosispiralis TaxID=2967341 RepID=A0ABT1VA78_9ACTN|nr:ABC transporter permease [Streptomyces rugosispiralis]MCQ8194304.1 ABC transporter permease [Streptomyces rugosispiralis]
MTLATAAQDSSAMVGRELRHLRRYPLFLVASVALPVLMFVLFVYVFGDYVGAGLSGSGSTLSYVGFLTPGILVMTVAAGALPSAVSVSTDMSEGIIDRFRTMPLARGAVLIGHVVGGIFRTVLAAILLTLVALFVGFRPAGGPLAWLAAAGIILAFAFALTWLAVAIGLAAKTPTGANSMTQIISTVLPFLSSAFVPTESMAVGIRWFAEYQPFTPVVGSVRALLTDTPVGNSVVFALAWCAVIAVVGYAWGLRSFRTKTA